MNGADSLVQTLRNGGVDVCFANPGTSEMHFVSALDRVAGLRSILCLFEGVATGAADGYARMAGKPAATLLHLGPGLAYGVPNLHNARRARTPIVNIVGEHATYHRKYNAPLTSNIQAIASVVSDWTFTSEAAAFVASDAARAVCAAREAPGGIATLILPADAAWNAATAAADPIDPPKSPSVEEERVDEAAMLLESGPSAIILGGDALRPDLRRVALGIGQRTGAQLLAPVGNKRIDRGRGTVPVERLPFALDLALQRLAKFESVVLIGCEAPVAFFAYPNKPSELLPETCRTCVLAADREDIQDALERLARRLGAGSVDPEFSPSRPSLPPDGPLTPGSIGAVIAAVIPEQAIVCDESITVGRQFYALTEESAPHTWLQITGGAIGCSVPMATGAAVACPERRVMALVGDGSAVYTLQALWTQAREQLNIVTVVLANRAYAILQGELCNVGAQIGAAARRMLSLEVPSLDWTRLAEGFGVPAVQVGSVRQFTAALTDALSVRGPRLIEVVVTAA
jgi:acetolactate synthase-1/2/3 large subunit